MASAGKLSGERGATIFEKLGLEQRLVAVPRPLWASGGSRWTEDEMLVAFRLYLWAVLESHDPQIVSPTGRLRQLGIKRLAERLCCVPKIARVAGRLGRDPKAVAVKICELAELDPGRMGEKVPGLVLHKKMWERFIASPDETLLESQRLLADLLGEPETSLEPDSVAMPEGREKESVVLARVNQDWFRRTVLDAYGGTCCVTGIADSRLLEAIHIVPWAHNRKEGWNPRNGLCLNVLHHRAFDRGLISIHPMDRVVLVSPRGMKTDFIAKSKGVKIRPPEKFPPDPAFLDFHCREIFEGVKRRRKRHDAGL